MLVAGFEPAPTVFRHGRSRLKLYQLSYTNKNDRSPHSNEEGRSPACDLGAQLHSLVLLLGRHYKAMSMADETRRFDEVANTKPLRWLMKRHSPRRLPSPHHGRKYQAFTMADETKTRGAPGLVCKVANTKPLRWLMKHYPFKHLIILHAPPSLREPLRTAGQGMPNSL